MTNVTIPMPTARPARALTARRIIVGALFLTTLGATVGGLANANVSADELARAAVLSSPTGSAFALNPTIIDSLSTGAPATGPAFRMVANTTPLPGEGCSHASAEGLAHGLGKRCTTEASAADAAFLSALRNAGMTINDEAVAITAGHAAVDAYVSSGGDRSAAMAAADNVITGGTGVWPEVPPVQGKGALPAILDAALSAYGA